MMGSRSPRHEAAAGFEAGSGLLCLTPQPGKVRISAAQSLEA